MEIALSLRVVFVALTFVGAASLHAAKKLVHPFILSGQSNMAHLEPAIDFLPDAQALLPGAEVVCLKVAAMGEPICRWLSEWDRITAAAQLRQRNKQGPVYYEQILAEFQKLQAQHPAFASITLCWMQGERDAKTGLAAAYERPPPNCQPAPRPALPGHERCYRPA